MLQVNDLDVFYGEAQALWGVTMSIAEGEVVSVIGSNGAGKSTLVNAVMGVLPTRHGSVVLDDLDLTQMPGHQTCRAGVSIVPEGRRLFPHLSVLDNLDLGAFDKMARPYHDETMESVLELFPRLAQRSGQLAGSLSGGEQQMVAIGRALMARPRLLLMDEPSLGLAPVVVDEVFDVMESVNARGVSVLLVEQNVERALAISSRGYLLSEGRIVMEAPAADLAHDPDVRRAVLGV